jgi:hypothetical protein
MLWVVIGIVFMKKFSVFINGTNFKRKEKGKLVKYGFYTTRYVEANHNKGAMKKAFILLKKEVAKYFIRDKSDPAHMFVEEIYELKSFGNELVPGKGFSLYGEKRRSKRTMQILRKKQA